MTKEEIIKKYDQKRMGGAQNSASSKSALSKEEIIKKYDERQAAKTRERQMIEIANRTPEDILDMTVKSYIPEEYKGKYGKDEKVDVPIWMPWFDRKEIAALNAFGRENAMTDRAKYLTDEEADFLSWYANQLRDRSVDPLSMEYMTGLAEELETRELEAKALEIRKKGDFGNSVYSIFNKAASGIEGISNVIDKAVLGREIDETPYYTTLGDMRRQKVSEDMSGFGKFLYDTTMSGLDSAVMTGIGLLTGGGSVAATQAISLIGMGSQAMSSTIADSKKRGMSDWKAIANGVVAGAIEAATEKIGIDALFDTKLFKNAVGSYFFKNIGSNAAEEALAEALGILSDGIIGQDKSNFKAKIREYEGKGYSESGAAAMAVLSSLGDTGLAALSGALMGLGFGGVGIAGNTIMTNAYDVRTGRQITELAHANTDLYGAAKLAQDAEIDKILDAVYKAQEGSRAKYRLTGKLARQTGGVYQQRQNGRFTPQEMDQQEIDIRKEDYVQTPFEREYDVYSEKVWTAAAVDLEEEAKALAAKNAGEDYGEKYEGDTRDAYYKGLANYKNKEKAYQYPLWFEIARKMGQDSNGRSVDEMIKTLPFSDRRGVLSLDTDTIKAAFNDGKRIADAIAEEQKAADERRKRGEERIAERKKAVEAEKGKESTEGEKTASMTTENKSNVQVSDEVKKAEAANELSPAQKTALKKIRQVMKYIPGYEVIVQKGNEYDSKLGNENGYFDPSTRTIYLNIDAGKVTGKIKIRGQDVAVELYEAALESALTHEIGHAIRVDSPKLWGELRDFIRTRLYSPSAYENAVRNRQKQYAAALGREIGYEYAEEEVICNSLGDILTSERVMDELAGTHRNLFARIWRLVKDFFSKILKRMRSMDGDFAYKTTEQRVVEKALLVERRRLEDLFVKALRDASATSRATLAIARNGADGAAAADELDGIKFSLMEDISLGESVDKVLSMSDEKAIENKEAGNFVSISKNTPDIILNNVEDAEDLEIIMRFDSFYLAARHDGAIKGNYHNFGAIMKELPEIISHPLAIVRMNNKRLNILASVPTAKGDNTTASIELNTVKDVNSKYSKYNMIVTLVPSKDNYMRNNLLNNGVKVEYEKEDLPQVNHQLHEWLAIINERSSTPIIPDSAEKSNPSDEKSLENGKRSLREDFVVGKDLPTNPTEAKVENKVDDLRFSLAYSDTIAKAQREYQVRSMAKISAKELDLAIEQTAEMVSIMEAYADILPQDKVTRKTLVKNGSYDYSVENTTICVRTLAYNAFVEMVSEKIKRPLSQMESFLVSQKLYEIAKEPQCLYCYVSLDRKAYNEMVLRYIEQRDIAIADYEAAGKPVINDKLRNDKSGIYHRFLDGRKDTDNMWDRYRKWITQYNMGIHLLTAEDVATEKRRADLAASGGVNAEQVTDILKYAQSASWAKKQLDYTAYNGEILKLSPRIVSNLNKHYGLRWYSFSDYTAAFIVENMQQITDASLRGLKGLSYTKDTDYARIFAPTGMNINVSVYVTRDTEGNYVIDERQSANLEEAIALREKYQNVGIVAVATDKAGVEWALAQEWTDVVIPFHTVRTGAQVAEFYDWTVFNEEQSDSVSDENLWDRYADSVAKSDAAKKKVSKMIYPSEHQNDRSKYLALVKERGLKPRFSQFLDNTNYMKLVNETRQSESATKPLQPIYDLDAAKESFGKFVDKGGYFEGWYNDGIDAEAEADVVAADVLAGKRPDQVDYAVKNASWERAMARRKDNRSHGRYSIKESIEGKFSLRDTLAREQLSAMFYEMAASPVEREIVEKYKAEIVDIDAKIDERREILERLSEIEGKSGFGGERERLEGRLKGVNAYITGRDRRLFELESAKPFKEMVERYDEEIRKYRRPSSSSDGSRLVTVPRGHYNELIAKKRQETYYTEEDAAAIERKIEGFDLLSPFNKKKIVEEFHQGMNAAVTEEEREGVIRSVSDHIFNELMRTFYGDESDEGYQGEKTAELQEVWSGVEKAVREAYDEGGHVVAYDKVTRDLDRLVWTLRNRKQGAFDKVVGENGESPMAMLRELAALEYAGSFSVKKMRDLVKQLQAWYKSDEAKRTLNYGNQWMPGEWLEAIAGKLQQISEGKGKASVQELEALKEVFSYFAGVAERYDEYHANAKDKKKLEDIKQYYKDLRAIDRAAWKLRGIKLGTFKKAADVDGWHPVRTLEELINMEYGGNFLVSKMREKVKYLAEWYGSEAAQEFIKYTEDKQAGKYSEEIAASMKALAKGKGRATVQELQTLASVLSYFHKMAEGYNKVWAKDKVDEIVSMQKGLIACDREARSIREMKLGVFDNMAEIKSEKVMGIVRELAKFTYRGTFPVNKVREKVRKLYAWYHSEEAKNLLNSVGEDTGEWSQFVENTLFEISEGEGAMTGDELMAFSKVLAHFRRIAQSYNKVWRAGKWEDALPIAETYIGKLLEAQKIKGGDVFFAKVYRTYFNEFADPLSVVRRYDGYIDGGYFTDTFLMFREAAVNLDTTYSNVMKEYNSFLAKKENRHYMRDIQARFVEIYGEKIPMDQAMSLYMMLCQDHALKGFVTHGFQYVGMNGDMKRAIPLENKIKRAVQDILFDQQTRKDYGVGDPNANKIVKEAIADENEFGTVEKLTIEELRAAVRPTLDAIERQLTDADIEMLGIIRYVMNGVLREMKRTTDLERLGFSNVMEGFYFPIMRIQKAQKLEMMSYHNELQSVSNISANKSREEGASQALRIYSIFTIFERHTRAIVTYATMQHAVDFYKRIANVSITGNPNDAQKVATYASEVWGPKKAETKGYFEYFNELIEDIQGLKTGRDNFINRLLGTFRGGMATAGIGLNGKVLLSQWSSYAAALPEMSFGSLMKAAAKRFGIGAKGIFSKEGRESLIEYGKIVDKHCPLARVRHEENYAYLAQGVIEKDDGTVKVKGKVTEGLNEFREATMKPIGWMDRAVICTLFEACKYETATADAPLDSEENLKAAGKKLEEVILNTQQNALATEKSRAMRSDQELMKGLVMFSSDSMRSLSRFLDYAGELHSINRQLKTFQMSDAAKETLQSRKKEVGRKLRNSIIAISANAIWMAALTLFFRFMRGKKIEREDILEDLALDIFTGYFGGMPLLRDLVDQVTKGYGVTDSALDSIGDFVGAFTSVFTTISKVIQGEREWGALVGQLRKFAFAIAQVTGVPVRNVWNCIYGWIKIISKDAADAVDEFLAG